MSTTCPHSETATALYRVEDELLCLDCAAERYVELDKRIIHAEVFAENLRVERDRLVALVGYSPAGTSRLLDHMHAAAPEAQPRSTYSMTVVDPDGYTRRLRVEADSEEAARASEEIREYERVVEVSPA